MSEIPEDMKELYAAIESFAHHSPEVCDCDLEGGDDDCKIEPKRPTPYEWEKLSSRANIRKLIERIAALTAERDEMLEGRKPKCPDCNSVGLSHCSDPENCGGVYWPDHLYKKLEAALDHVWEVSSGETQVAMDDTQGMEYLCDYVSSIVGDSKNRLARLSAKEGK